MPTPPQNRFAFALLLMVCCGAVAKAADTPAPQEKGAYVTVNVGIELNAIEKAADEVARSMDHLATSVSALASSPSLTPEQRSELLAVIGRVDALSGRVVEAIEHLPAAVRESKEPVVAIADGLASDVRLTVILTLVVALLVILAALVGVYLFVLKPSRALVVDTVKGIAGVVRSVENTAQMISRTTEQQTHLLSELQRAGLAGGPTSGAGSADPPEGAGSADNALGAVSAATPPRAGSPEV